MKAKEVKMDRRHVRGGGHFGEVALRILLYTVLALLAALFAIFGRGLTLGQAALVFLAAMVLLLGMTYLTLRINTDRFRRRLLGELLPVLDAYRIEHSLVREGFLLSGPALDNYEATCEATRIIVASANLDHDVPGARVFETVRRNIDGGKNYVYIIPDTPAMRKKAQHSCTGLGASTRNVSYLAFHPEKVAGLTDTNLAAYYLSNGESVVFTELPVDPDPDKRLWARLHRDYAYQVAGRLEMLAESGTATWQCPNQKNQSTP
jgi:hypothetical protein